MRTVKRLKVLVYAENRTVDGWRFLGEQLRPIADTLILSEFRGQGDIYISDAVRRQFAVDPTQYALHTLGSQECQEIAARCRILRSQPWEHALRLIGAVLKVLEEVVEREKPDFGMSFTVDSFVMDLFERVLRRRGITFIGLVDAVIPHRAMLFINQTAARLRKPEQAEISEFIHTVTAPQFRPFLPDTCTFTLAAFARTQAFYELRSWAFEILRRIAREPFNSHYLATKRHVCDYQVSFKDWQLMRHIDGNWAQKLQATPSDRRVFVALQANPEASTDYWVHNTELIDPSTVLSELANALTSAGYRVFVKDHPNHFGFRRMATIERLLAHQDVTLVPYEVASQKLIDECVATFTWTGTVGLEAAMRGRCAIVTTPYYYIAPHFIQVNSRASVATVAERVQRFRSPSDIAAVRYDIAYKVLSQCIAGTARALVTFRLDPSGSEADLRALGASLLEHLPVLRECMSECVA